MACRHQSLLLLLRPPACRASLGLQRQVNSALHVWLQTSKQLPLPCPQRCLEASSLCGHRDIALHPAAVESGCCISDCLWKGSHPMSRLLQHSDQEFLPGLSRCRRKDSLWAIAALPLRRDGALTHLAQLLVDAAQGQAAAALLAAVAAGVAAPGSSCALAPAPGGEGTAPWTGWAWHVGSGWLQQCCQILSLPVGGSMAACRQGTARGQPQQHQCLQMSVGHCAGAQHSCSGTVWPQHACPGWQQQHSLHRHCLFWIPGGHNSIVSFRQLSAGGMHGHSMATK